MITVPYSGGLAMGAPGGPQIDVIPIPPRPAGSADATSLLIEAGEVVQPDEGGVVTIWQKWSPSLVRSMGLPVLPSVERMTGVIGLAMGEGGPIMAIRFSWPRHIKSPVDAMRQIEEAERGALGGNDALCRSFAAVVGACLTAAKAIYQMRVNREIVVAPSVIAALSASFPCRLASRPRPLSKREIDERAWKYVRRLVLQNRSLVGDGADGTDAPPDGTTDRARYFISASRQLWRQEIISAMARQERIPSPLTQLRAGLMAASWLDVRGASEVTVSGVKLSVAPDDYIVVWPQTIAMYGIPALALRFLLPDGKFPAASSLIDEGDTPQWWGEHEARLARGLTTALVREAEEKGEFAPYGMFYLPLPDGYPLRRWGVAALRVCAYPDHLWVGVVLDPDEEGGRGTVGLVFPWWPNRPVTSLVVSESAAPVVEMTMAALWRDLRVAGEEAVPKRRRRRMSARRSMACPPSMRFSPRLTLPRRWVRVEVSGSRRWGGEGDGVVIRCRAHSVRGHLRRLPRGWKASEQAKQVAEAFGVVLPDGFTFVRPHVRGGRGGEKAILSLRTEKPDGVRVKAKGLVTVMTMFKGGEVG